MKILIIEDDIDLSAILKKGFMKKGYIVDTAADGLEGDELSYVNDYDVIILDLNLPNIDGFEVLKNIRKEKPNQRVIILSARSTIENKIEGLDLGANDYVTKPFDFRELEARVRNLLRNNFVQSPPIIKYKGLEYDTRSKKYAYNSVTMDFAPKEAMILEYLLYNIGKTISSEELIEHLWGSDDDTFELSLKPHISRIRKKLKEVSKTEFIMTVRGKGYLLPEDKK